MSTTSLAASGYVVKPHVASASICESSAMRKAVKKEAKSELQELFMRRLEDEMGKRHISANQIAANAKAKGLKLGQTTVSRILRGEQDPTLQKLHAVSIGVGLPSWFLLSEPNQSEQVVIKPPALPATRANVLKMKSPYEPSIKIPEQSKQKSRARNKKTG